MALSSLLSKVSNTLTKYSPVHKSVADAAGDYVETGSKKSLAKVMTPFAVGAAIPVAMAAAPAGGLSSLAAGAGRLGTTATRTAGNAAKSSLSKLSQVAKSPAGKVAGVGAGTVAVGAGVKQFLDTKRATDSTGEVIKNQQEQSSGSGTGNADDAMYGTGGGSGSSREDRERMRLIGSGWDEMTDELGSLSKTVSGYASELDGRLGNLRKSFLGAIDESQRQDNMAIEGQKTLVTKERDSELGEVAADARKGFFQANQRYGGPKASSAGMMASKGVQGMAEKSRRQILTEVGTMFADLKQKAKEVEVTAERQRQDVYDLEDQLKQEAMADFTDSMKALKKLSEKKGSWKQKDIDGKSDAYLTKLANSLATISAQAKARRDQIRAAEYEIGNQIKDLRQKAALTFAPPELEAEQIDLGEAINPGDSEEDFFNSDAPERRRIGSKVKNILEELDQEDAAAAEGAAA